MPKSLKRKYIGDDGSILGPTSTSKQSWENVPRFGNVNNDLIMGSKSHERKKRQERLDKVLLKRK